MQLIFCLRLGQGVSKIITNPIGQTSNPFANEKVAIKPAIADDIKYFGLKGFFESRIIPATEKNVLIYTLA